MSTVLARTLLMTIALVTVAGCASDPRYNQGLEWITYQEEERKRLQAQGFPQYSPGP